MCVWCVCVCVCVRVLAYIYIYKYTGFYRGFKDLGTGVLYWFYLGFEGLQGVLQWLYKRPRNKPFNPKVETPILDMTAAVPAHMHHELAYCHKETHPDNTRTIIRMTPTRVILTRKTTVITEA